MSEKLNRYKEAMEKCDERREQIRQLFLKVKDLVLDEKERELLRYSLMTEGERVDDNREIWETKHRKEVHFLKRVDAEIKARITTTAKGDRDGDGD